MHRLIYCLFGLLVFCSCSQNRVVAERLDVIEQQIQENPDQALLLLDSVAQAEPDAMSDEAVLSKYILLDAYCKYRLMEEGANDSLISIAERYFEAHGSARDVLLCKFLHGVILFNASRMDTALQLFKEAEAVGSQCGDHFLLGRLYGQMSLLCNHLCDADFPRYAEKSMEEFVLSGDSGFILDSRINYAISLLDCHQPEECLALLKDLLPLAECLDDTFCLSKIYTFMGESEICLQRFDSALGHLNIALSIPVPNFLGQTYSMMALCYGYLQKRDSSLYYFQLTKEQVPNFETDYTCLKNAAYMYKYLGDYPKALDYHIQYHNRIETKRARRLNYSFSKGQRDFAEKRIAFFEREVRMKKLFSAFLIFVLVAGCAFFIYYRNQQRRILKLQDDNQKNVLRGMILSTVVTRLKQMASEETIPSESDWNDLNQLFEEMLPSFERKLRQKNSLSEIEWRICQLEKLGFSNKEVATLICKAKNTISTANAKLFKQRFGVDGGSSGWLDFIQKL